MACDQAYYEAEKKIEEALKSGATELNLRDMRLTELPESIGNLIQLQKLDLGGDWVKRGDENNKLTTLPNSLKQLAQLQLLNLSSNQLTPPPEWLGQLTQLQSLNLSRNQLKEIPEWTRQLTQLQSLDISDNELTTLPDSLGQLTQLTELDLSDNQLTALPDSLGQLTQLESLNFFSNRIKAIPDWIDQFQSLVSFAIGNNPITSLPESLGSCTAIEFLDLGDAAGGCPLKEIPASIGQLHKLERLIAQTYKITDLPPSLAQLEHLKELDLDNNPLNPELAEAYKQGIPAVKAYLRAKAEAQIILNEAKLILVGEGEVGKTCLMDALLGKEWQEHPSTHGIEIQQVKITDTESNKEITLNGWDFGGQKVYRPTHQLFFSAPAVYLVVWKPREGFKQNFVEEWIQLVKRREPSAKIIVVATHGGPQQRQPDIDRQELWDTFGKETVADFFWVDSKPDKNGNRKGIEELKLAIARVAAALPEVGRSVPKSFQDVRQALQATGVPYLPLDEVLAICRAQDMDDEIARLFITISHRLGHLTHYENDPALREFHSFLKEKDPGFGGLVRVMDKQQKFLWVHEQFKGEY